MWPLSHGHACFTAEHHVTYLNELRTGDTMSARVRLLGRSERAAHVLVYLLDETHQQVACVVEEIFLHIDLEHPAHRAVARGRRRQAGRPRRRAREPALPGRHVRVRSPCAEAVSPRRRATGSLHRAPAPERSGPARASVAQGIEHWFPVPGAAGSNPAGGAHCKARTPRGSGPSSFPVVTGVTNPGPCRSAAHEDNPATARRRRRPRPERGARAVHRCRPGQAVGSADDRAATADQLTTFGYRGDVYGVKLVTDSVEALDLKDAHAQQLCTRSAGKSSSSRASCRSRTTR